MSYLRRGVLIACRGSTTGTSLLVSVAGAALIVSSRSVLTSGVMIALTLVPSATIAGMTLVAGEPDLAVKALLRWAIEVAFVSLASLLVFTRHRARVQRRRTQL